MRTTHMRSLKQYLFLIRLPNVFTVPSNIFAGYFSSTPSHEVDLLQLSMLTASSVLLYVCGMALNDYFDLEIDRRERPRRPLPSGQITRKNALALAIAAMALANTIAYLVSVTSFAVSAALSAVIFAYDYRVKKSRFGPLCMGAARFLNVVFGASAASSCVWCPITTATNAEVQVPLSMLGRTLFAAGAMFAYVYAITLLSRREAGEQKDHALAKTIWQSFSIVFATVAATALFVFFYLGSAEMSAINMLIFGGAVIFAWKQAAYAHLQKNIRHAVRDLLLSIVILDSVFVTAFAGLYFGLLTLLLIAPAVFLARKLYVT